MAHPGTTAPEQIDRTGQTTPAAPDDRPAGVVASQRSPRRIRGVRVPAVVRDVVLIVLGALLALAADEWREGRERSRRAQLAVGAIRAELEANLAMVEEARALHIRMRDTLRGYVSRRELPPLRVYASGVVRPAPVTATAWDAARETGVLAELPYALVLRIAPVYEAQERYRTLTDGVVREMMTDVMRLGFEPVLRDRTAQIAALDEDFSNREAAMAERYRRALVSLDSAAARRRP